MSHHCPSCKRVIYSRRLKNCGYCGEPIPESSRFTAEEIAVQDQEIAELKAQRSHRAQLAKEKEQEQARRSATGDGLTDFLPFL